MKEIHGFSKRNVARIGKAVSRVEGGIAGRPGRSHGQTPFLPLLIRGVLDGDLDIGDSAVLSIWKYDGTSDVDTTKNITVYDYGVGAIVADTAVSCLLDISSGRYYVIGTGGKVKVNVDDALDFLEDQFDNLNIEADAEYGATTDLLIEFDITDSTGNKKIKAFIDASEIDGYVAGTQQLLGHAADGGFTWYDADGDCDA